MSNNQNQNTNNSTANNNAPAPETQETKTPEVKKTGFFGKVVRWFNAPIREALHPVKFHQDEAARHLDEAVKLSADNPKDEPTLVSVGKGFFRVVKRAAAVGVLVAGAMTMKEKISNNSDTDQPLLEDNTIESTTDDVIE